MIEKTTGFKAGDILFTTIEGAQGEELRLLLKQYSDSTGNDVSHGGNSMVIKWVIQNSAHIVNILTTGPKSKPKARAINGGKKARKVKTVTVPDSWPNIAGVSLDSTQAK